MVSPTEAGALRAGPAEFSAQGMVHGVCGVSQNARGEEGH